MEGHERVWRVWQERYAWLAPHWIVYGFVGGVMAIAYQQPASTRLPCSPCRCSSCGRRRRRICGTRRLGSEAPRGRGDDPVARTSRSSRRTVCCESDRRRRWRAWATVEPATRTRRATHGASSSSRCAIGRELGLSQAELDLLGHAALFHDIGKLAVPDAILFKPAVLTDDEWALMQRHSDEGARIIDRLGFLNDAVPAIRHHHERFDGTGYPDGLKGEEIPLGARIIHVADALDSMLTRASTARPGLRRGDGRAQACSGRSSAPAAWTLWSACSRPRSWPTRPHGISFSPPRSRVPVS